MEEVHFLFSQKRDRESLARAKQILENLAMQYESEGQLHISASMHLFAAALAASLKDDQTALQIFQKVLKNARYDAPTHSLAECAAGIIYERQGQLKLAKQAFENTVRKFENTPASEEAREWLSALAKK